MRFSQYIYARVVVVFGGGGGGGGGVLGGRGEERGFRCAILKIRSIQY